MMMPPDPSGLGMADMDGDEAVAALGGGSASSPQIEALLQAILGNGERIDPKTLMMILQMMQEGGDAFPGGVL